MNLKPLGDRVVIKVIPQEEKLASGIVLPGNAKEKPQEGEVVAIGTGRILDNGTRLPMEISVGDMVIYSKYAGSEVKVEGEEYLILSEKDILAISK
ncbi:MAG: co-chaperone GroES [Symbiobacteriaceae bacterium]|nr:co-chaperone GroES [Symbiobacteriaceae bacterium]